MLLLVGLGLLVLLLGSAGVFWAKFSAWLVDHNVLAPAAAQPLVALPGGAGLDGPRVLAAVCVGVLVAAIGISALLRRRRQSPPIDE